VRFGSPFSGIEAASAAWLPLGWTCAWTAEIDPFASAVLRHHYPDTPNLGDVNRIDTHAVEPVDLVVFGSPCQSFSVAGKRLGLDDPRGNMALVGLRVVGKLRPSWVVWENVPGVLSSDEGRDFGAFLGLLGELGYGFAHTVLDAQHAGVPQRRRRVFVVGYLGDWRPPAAVLFEPESLRGDPAPRREAGEDAPAGAGDGSAYSCRPNSNDAAWRGDGADNFVADIARCVATGSNAQRYDYETDTLIAHALDAASAGRCTEDGTGRGTPLVTTRGQDQNGLGISMDGIAYTLDNASQHAVMFDPTARQPEWSLDRPMKTDGPPAVAYGIRSDAARNGEALTPSADAEGRVRLRDPGFNVYEETSPTLDSTAHAAMQGMSVRRLTPIECEKLQGFPPGWTDVPYRGKPAADGPRYRAIGNSMAVPIVKWIGERIQAFEDAQAELADAAD
jgi:DNA (cytosine-5)-methyltransferase 1